MKSDGQDDCVAPAYHYSCKSTHLQMQLYVFAEISVYL
jgi:hypothetical protein